MVLRRPCSIPRHLRPSSPIWGHLRTPQKWKYHVVVLILSIEEGFLLHHAQLGWLHGFEFQPEFLTQSCKIGLKNCEVTKFCSSQFVTFCEIMIFHFERIDNSEASQISRNRHFRWIEIFDKLRIFYRSPQFREINFFGKSSFLKFLKLRLKFLAFSQAHNLTIHNFIWQLCLSWAR